MVTATRVASLLGSVATEVMWHLEVAVLHRAATRAGSRKVTWAPTPSAAAIPDVVMGVPRRTQE